jgi:hypothetical protein
MCGMLNFYNIDKNTDSAKEKRNLICINGVRTIYIMYSLFFIR